MALDHSPEIHYKTITIIQCILYSKSFGHTGVGHFPSGPWFIQLLKKSTRKSCTFQMSQGHAVQTRFKCVFYISPCKLCEPKGAANFDFFWEFKCYENTDV